MRRWAGVRRAAPAGGAPGWLSSVTCSAQAPLLNEATRHGISYVRGSSEVPLLDETIGQGLARVAATHPDREALVTWTGTRLTYAGFLEQVEGVARGLLRLGVRRGERVAVWAPNREEWVTTQFAVAKIGAVLVNINTANKATELAHCLGTCGASTLVLAPELRGTSFTGIVEGLLKEGRLPTLRRRVLLGSSSGGGGGASGLPLSRRSGTCESLTWDDVRSAGEGPRFVDTLWRREAGLQPGDPYNIQFTSGTTGEDGVFLTLVKVGACAGRRVKLAHFFNHACDLV